MICYIPSYCLNIYFGQIIIKRTWLRKKIVLTQFGYYPAFNHINVPSKSLSLQLVSDIQYAEQGKCTHEPFLRNLLRTPKS